MESAIESNVHTPPRRKLSSVLLLVLTIVALVVGVGCSIFYSIPNPSLAAEIRQLESKFGVMVVEDPERVYFAAIENPDVPTVIAEHVERVWQYQFYFPQNYDFRRFCGDGSVSADGFYCGGSTSTGWSSANLEAANDLMTISVTRKKNHFELFTSIGRVRVRGRLECRDLPNAKLEDFVIEPVLPSGETSCSFSRNEIIPFLKIYDPATARERMVGGRKLTTYQGALVVIYPTSQKRKFELLLKGELVHETQVSGEASP